MAQLVFTEGGLQALVNQIKARQMAEEGKGLSTNDFTDEYKQMIDDLAYVQIAVSSMSATNASNEIGSTVTQTTVTWTLNKTPESLTIKFGSEAEITLENTATSYQFTGKTITSNTVITLKATDERDYTATRTASISFSPKVYWGTSDQTTFESAQILGLANSALAGSRARTFTVNAEAGQYIVYAFPTSFGTPTFNVGGFDGGFVKTGTVEFQNASGYTQNYDVWRSVNAGLGNTTVKVS